MNRELLVHPHNLVRRVVIIVTSRAARRQMSGRTRALVLGLRMVAIVLVLALALALVLALVLVFVAGEVEW